MLDGFCCGLDGDELTGLIGDVGGRSMEGNGISFSDGRVLDLMSNAGFGVGVLETIV